jgi:coenzyme F420-reducing hydrogenase delta subunit
VLVPCTGRVDEALMLRAFERGADGVLVVGCLEGDCHFQVGNLRARKRVARVAGLLEAAGVGGQRIRMVNLSAGEGAKFVRYAEEMVEHITALGPSPIARSEADQRLEGTT